MLLLHFTSLTGYLEHLNKKFIKRSNIHIRETRTCDVLHISKTATGQRTRFKYRATNIWNSLDKSSKGIKSLKTFIAVG